VGTLSSEILRPTVPEALRCWWLLAYLRSWLFVSTAPETRRIHRRSEKFIFRLMGSGPGCDLRYVVRYYRLMHFG
jgi:hypothetical protein